MPQLVLLRHGQSQWNLEQRFTGWVDVPLTELGKQEARKAASRLKGLPFGAGFTSVLQRAWQSMEIILDVMGQSGVVVTRDKALNERNYGSLQGMSHEEARRIYGVRKVELWRRSYDSAPPGPGGESLRDTAARTIPFLMPRILPLVREGKDVLVVAHGNSLRSIAMHLERMTEAQIEGFEFGTGIPRLYQMNAEAEVTSVRNII